VAFEVARAVVEKFGNDSLTEMKARWNCSTGWPENARTLAGTKLPKLCGTP